jgi:hypothetical protein
MFEPGLMMSQGFAGKLYRSEADRITMLGLMVGLLIENCGADAAVRIGNPEVWREAVRGLPNSE